jgi:hypothetical protein
MAARTALAAALGAAALLAATTPHALAGAATTPRHTAATAADPAGVPETAVDPTTLPRGAAPRIAYLRTDTGVIHDQGRRIKIRIPGGAGWFARVAGGYLVSGGTARTGPILATYDSKGHRRRVVARDVHGGLSVDPAGRRVAYLTTDRWAPDRIVVRRLSDGAKLADRTFTRNTSVAAFGTHRMLLAQGPKYTTWWTLGRHKLDIYSEDAWTQDADLRAHQVVQVSSESGLRVLSIPRGAQKRWAIAGLGYPDSVDWTPDYSRLLISSGYEDEPESHDSWVDVVSRTGTRLRRFTDSFSPYGSSYTRWESNDTFLTWALKWTGETDVYKGALVRCNVDGTCERASAVYPGYYDFPYLLAAPRTG